ncbi:MAG: peptidase domain-containing ABC transporter, partial [Thermoanaerobaculia bacterium]
MNEAAAVDATNVELARDDFVWLLGSLCQLNRIPFDPSLLLQRFPAPHSVRQFIEAATSLGFKTGRADVPGDELKGLTFPCVGFLRSDKPQPAIFVKGDAERVVYFPAGKNSPETHPVAAFREKFEPWFLLVRHENAADLQGDGAPEAGRFGFRWFWNELLRHKRIWRDVLLASLFIQLIGLTTPLFTQVIIDKVVVHQTSSTLIAIAVG